MALTTATKERGGRASLWAVGPGVMCGDGEALCLTLCLCSGHWLLACLMVACVRCILRCWGAGARRGFASCNISCGPTVRALVALEGIVDLLQARTLIAFGASGGPI